MINELVDLKPLKKGGQKEVYSGVHPTYGDIVFKKIFPNPNSLSRTKREIRAVALLNDANFIPKIISHNCSDQNPEFLWLVEERVNGSNLRDVFSEGKVFETQEIVNFLDTMLKIAVLSEEANLVHRDIKPENIILDSNNNFWLLDFGIARHLDLVSITESKEPFGLFTVGYTSSEQFRNLKKMIDIRADLFSIGVVCQNDKR